MPRKSRPAELDLDDQSANSLDVDVLRQTYAANECSTGPMSRVFENWLFLGSLANAANGTMLVEHNIKFILNVGAGLPNLFCDSIQYLNIELVDNEKEEIVESLDIGTAFIEHGRLFHVHNGGCVLVHCLAGMSRSASFILGYLIRYQDYSLVSAYYHLLTKRFVHPNIGFLRQLEAYELRHRGASTFSQLSLPESSCFDDPHIYPVVRKFDSRPSSKPPSHSKPKTSRSQCCTIL